KAIVVDIDADVWVVEKEVNAIEFDTIHGGIGSEFEHGIEVNGRFGAVTAFADEAGPHGVMKFGIVAMTMFSAHKLDDSEKRGFTLQRIGKGGNGKRAVVVS